MAYYTIVQFNAYYGVLYPLDGPESNGIGPGKIQVNFLNANIGNSGHGLRTLIHQLFNNPGHPVL